MNKFIKWHKDYCENWRQKYNMSHYGIYWVSFIKGVLLVILFCLLTGCSLPLVGSIGGNGVTAIATGQYEKSLISSGIDIAVHSETGQTTSEIVLEKLGKK